MLTIVYFSFASVVSDSRPVFFLSNQNLESKDSSNSSASEDEDSHCGAYTVRKDHHREADGLYIPVYIDGEHVAIKRLHSEKRKKLREY